jgi:hypothetical protein
MYFMAQSQVEALSSTLIRNHVTSPANKAHGLYAVAYLIWSAKVVSKVDSGLVCGPQSGVHDVEKK